MDLFVEFKIADTSDPFHNPEDPLRPKEDDFRFENDSDDGRLIRGQLAFYAAAHAESTRDSFVVIVMARPLPGTSTILKSPTFSPASFQTSRSLPAGLRHHLTRDSSIQQIHLFEGRLRDDNPAHREFRILMVLDRDDPTVEMQFIISFPPKYMARPPFGRATQPMLAFDVEARDIVFLKDHWRRMWMEGDIYARLNSNHVPNIAPLEREIIFAIMRPLRIR